MGYKVMTEPRKTVGQYLVDRLSEIGIKHLFAIPGDGSDNLTQSGQQEPTGGF